MRENCQKPEAFSPIGLRKLTPQELELVSGGTITVNGSPDRWGDSFDRDWYERYFDNEFFESDNYNDGGGSGGGGDLSEAASTALQITDAKHAVAQQLFEKYGPNLEIKFPDGSVSKITDLLDGLGKLSTGIQGGITLGEVATGEKEIRDAYHFVFGVTVTAAASEAGAGAVVAGGLGIGAEYVANHMLDWIEAMGDANDELKAYFNEQVAQWVNENSNIAPGTYDNPIELFRGMMGLPNYGNNPNIRIP